MTGDINLLPESHRHFEKRLQFKKRLEIGSIIVLVLTIVIIIGVFVFWSRQTKQLADLKASIKTQEERINNYKDLEGKISILKSKVTAINTIVSSDSQFRQTIDTMGVLVAESGVSLQTLSLSEDGRLVIAAKANNSDELSSFINLLSDPSKQFESTTLSSLSAEGDGSYKFNISLKVKNNE